MCNCWIIKQLNHRIDSFFLIFGLVIYLCAFCLWIYLECLTLSPLYSAARRCQRHQSATIKLCLFFVINKTHGWRLRFNFNESVWCLAALKSLSLLIKCPLLGTSNTLTLSHTAHQRGQIWFICKCIFSGFDVNFLLLFYNIVSVLAAINKQNI